MWELVPISVAGVVLAFLSHAFSEYDPLHCRYRRKDSFFYVVLVVAMVLFVGLRTGYNDTGTYQGVYEATPASGSLFEGMNWELGENPGFFLTNRILRQLGFSTQSFLMFYAVITVTVPLWFYRKYSCDFPVTIFLFITFAGYTFTLAAIKQCMAMALAMIAVDRALQKKYPAFLFWVLLASTYHAYALMYLMVPFLMFRPWSGWTVVMLGAFAVAGVIIESLMGTIIDITDMLGENYTAESFTGEGVHPLRLAAVSAPVLISFLTRKNIAAENNRTNNLMLNLSMLNAEIMFVALFGTANYFARLANYFLPFQAVAVPWLFTHFEPKSKKLITVVAAGCYLVFFVYSHMYQGGFDGGFSSISLWQYLQSLLMWK